jgi:hypothetical protein
VASATIEHGSSSAEKWTSGSPWVVALGESHAGVWLAVRMLSFFAHEPGLHVSLTLCVTWNICVDFKASIVLVGSCRLTLPHPS